MIPEPNACEFEAEPMPQKQIVSSPDPSNKFGNQAQSLHDLNWLMNSLPRPQPSPAMQQVRGHLSVGPALLSGISKSRPQLVPSETSVKTALDSGEGSAKPNTRPTRGTPQGEPGITQQRAEGVEVLAAAPASGGYCAWGIRTLSLTLACLGILATLFGIVNAQLVVRYIPSALILSLGLLAWDIFKAGLLLILRIYGALASMSTCAESPTLLSFCWLCVAAICLLACPIVLLPIFQTLPDLIGRVTLLLDSDLKAEGLSKWEGYVSLAYFIEWLLCVVASLGIALLLLLTWLLRRRLRVPHMQEIIPTPEPPPLRREPLIQLVATPVKEPMANKHVQQ